jgi:hypothetical protein
MQFIRQRRSGGRDYGKTGTASPRYSTGRARFGISRRSLSTLAALVAASVWLSIAVTPTLLGNGGALWRIVHGECVPHQLRGEGPAPCSLVDLQDNVVKGYAVLKDLRGRAQFLLIPTARITGIESPVLLKPEVTNYFAQAWRARTFVEERLGHPWGNTLIAGSAGPTSLFATAARLIAAMPDLGPEASRSSAWSGQTWTAT